MIAEFLFCRPRILLLAVLVIVTAGVSSVWVMPQLEDPALGKRVGVVSTIFPGANASRVEALVTSPLESELNGIVEIQRIRANTRSGISNLVIELKDGVTDVDPIWRKVADAVDRASGDLPPSCRLPVLEIFPLKAFAAIVSVQPKQSQRLTIDVVRRLAGNLATEIAAIDHTESVETFGDPGEEWVVEIEPETLIGIRQTPGSIAQQISAEQSSQPAGVVEGQVSNLLVDLGANESSARGLAKTRIAIGRGETVSLSEIATVQKRLVQPPADVALIDGRPAIVIGAFVSDQAGVNRWADQLDSVINQFQNQYAAELDIKLIFSQQQHIRQRFKGLMSNLLVGMAAVIGVTLLLMGWRSMVVVATALPLSAAMVLFFLRLLDIPLHQMSITGLIVALGLLIDNAIIMVEDVRRRLTAGRTAVQSLRESIHHLRIPLLGSTLTTTLAFLPIALLPGPAGEFVGSIAISVILAVGASFVLAMTVIPASFALLEQRFGVNKTQGPTENETDRSPISFSGGIRVSALKTAYQTSLRFVLCHPILGIVACLFFPAVGFLVSSRLPLQFFPAADRNQIHIEIELPARDSIANTVETMKRIDPLVAKAIGVENVYWFAGRSAPTFYYNVVPRRRGTPFYAQAIVDVSPGIAPQTVIDNLQSLLNVEAPACRSIVRQLQQGPPLDAPIEIQVQGPDLGVLQNIGSQLRLILSETPHVTHTRSDLEESIPTLSLNVDQHKAAELGLDSTEIATQLYGSLQGVPAGSVFDGQQEIPIRVRMQHDQSGAFGEIDTLAAMHVMPGQKSEHNRGPAIDPKTGQRIKPEDVPVSSLAEINLSADYGAIVHLNGRRTNEIMAFIESDVLSSTVVADFKQRLAEANLSIPDGYQISFGGEGQQRSQAVNRLMANAIMIGALMVLTLVASFGSFRLAGIVAAVGALSVGLSPLALWWFGLPFGFMAIVGTMGLVGIAINDSIVVLAAISEDRLSDRGDVDATVQVIGQATRHIIATTLTTIAGFTPLVLSSDGFWPPLAITIVGGVGGATLMALYLAPVLKRLMFRGAAS